MKNKKNLIITGIVLFVVGVSTCFAAAIMISTKEVQVTIERAGMCNPLKPKTEKTVSIDDKTKNKIQSYWKKTDKTKEPEAHELCDCVISDYKITIDEDEFFYNLDVGYIYFNDKEVDINDEFHKYLNRIIKENDKELE